MLFLPSFAALYNVCTGQALRDWRFSPIYFVARGSKYLSTSSPLAPRILGKLANCIIWDHTTRRHLLPILLLPSTFFLLPLFTRIFFNNYSTLSWCRIVCSLIYFKLNPARQKSMPSPYFRTDSSGRWALVWAGPASTFYLLPYSVINQMWCRVVSSKTTVYKHSEELSLTLHLITVLLWI